MSDIRHAKHVLAEAKACQTGLQRFNEQTGLAITNVLGSMAFFWFCVILDFVAFTGLVLATPATFRIGGFFAVALAWVVFVSQTVIQLLALPVIQHSGNRTQEHQAAQEQATYENAVTANTKLDALLKEMDALLHAHAILPTREEGTE